jgi:polysaccharide biosynthesis/export protein
MLNRLAPALFGITLAGFLPACGLFPGTGPTSDAVNGYATAGIRSTASLPYALVDISSDTIGFLSQPNLINFSEDLSLSAQKPTRSWASATS